MSQKKLGGAFAIAILFSIFNMLDSPKLQKPHEEHTLILPTLIPQLADALTAFSAAASKSSAVISVIPLSYIY